MPREENASKSHYWKSSARRYLMICSAMAGGRYVEAVTALKLTATTPPTQAGNFATISKIIRPYFNTFATPVKRRR